MYIMTPSILLPIVTFICAAEPESPRQLTEDQEQHLRFIRQNSHVLTAIVYKREIIPDPKHNNDAIEVSHAIVTRTMKGSTPEGARIIWVRPLEVLMNGAVYTHTIFPGKPFPYHIIGSVCGELKGGVKVIWEPVRITPLQGDFYTSFISLGAKHREKWKQALKAPHPEPSALMSEDEWKTFEQQIETAAANDPEHDSTSF